MNLPHNLVFNFCREGRLFVLNNLLLDFLCIFLLFFPIFSFCLSFYHLSTAVYEQFVLFFDTLLLGKGAKLFLRGSFFHETTKLIFQRSRFSVSNLVCSTKPELAYY